MKYYSDRFFLLACLLCALPVMLPLYPAMVDVPQHAAQVAALKSLLTEGAWRFSDMFELKLFTPYWLGYGVVMLFTIFFDPVIAMKLVVAGSQCLFVWAAARFCARMKMPAEWRWLFLLLPFGFAYQWGFLNFIVAAPFGFLFLLQVLKLRDKSSKRAILQTIAWVHFLFFAHFLIAAFFCAVAIFMLADSCRSFRQWLVRSLPVFSVLPVTIAWFVIGYNSAPEARGAIVWSIGINRLIEFLPSLVSSPQIGIGQLIGLLCLLLPFAFGARPKCSVLAWSPFALYIAWMLCVPHALGGNAFTYQRFGIFGLPLYYICFDAKSGEAPRHQRLAGIGMAFIAIAFVGWHSVRSMVFDAEARGYQAVMKKAEPEKRVLMLAFNRMSQASFAPLYLHFAGWYQAEHGGLAEFSFARFWGMPVRYKADASSKIYIDFEWSPQSLDWQHHRGELFDYFLVRHPLDASEWIREKSGDTVRLIERSGEWQLYGRK